MKLVIQRVSSASVSVNGKVVSQIGKGVFVLIGIGKGDTEEDAKVLAEKLSKMRVMSDQTNKRSHGSFPRNARKMNLAVKDVNGEILVVSQFTLYADTKGGNRPSFIDAADPKIAEPIYNCFVEQLQQKGILVKTGVFGEYMEIDLFLDGPVTIILN